MVENKYNPYCPVCSGCGEDGCCSALMCKHDPKGDYCESYLKDLHFAYLMYQDIYDLVCEDEKYKKIISEIFNKNYDKIY